MRSPATSAESDVHRRPSVPEVVEGRKPMKAASSFDIRTRPVMALRPAQVTSGLTLTLDKPEVQQVAVAKLVGLDRAGQQVQPRDDHRRELQPPGRVDRQQPHPRPPQRPYAPAGGPTRWRPSRRRVPAATRGTTRRPSPARSAGRARRSPGGQPVGPEPPDQPGDHRGLLGHRRAGPVGRRGPVPGRLGGQDPRVESRVAPAGSGPDGPREPAQLGGPRHRASNACAGASSYQGVPPSSR